MSLRTRPFKFGRPLDFARRAWCALRYWIVCRRVQARADTEEMELWPELMWLMASLVRAGCSPQTVFGYLLDQVRQADEELAEDEGLTGTPGNRSEADRYRTATISLAVLRARSDQETFLTACATTGHGRGLASSALTGT